jgi:FMN phosphatase YigB (HAD superfamily)
MTARRPMVAAVTTDLWYTVCYLSVAAQRSVEAERRRLWSGPLRATGLPSGAALAHVRALERWNDSEERRGFAPHLDRQAAWLARRTGATIDAAEVAYGLNALLRSAPVRPAPGVRPALRALRDRGLRLGLVSNLVNETSEGARTLLEDLELQDLYVSRQFSPGLPWSKPRPGPFRRCLAELGVAPGRAVHVGDRGIDRLGAHRAGMRAIVYTGLHGVEFVGSPPAVDRPPLRAIRAATWPQVLRRIERMQA